LKLDFEHAKNNVNKDFSKNSNKKIVLIFLVIIILIFLRDFILELDYWLFAFGFVFIFAYIFLKSKVEHVSFINELKNYITFIPFAYPEAKWRKIQIQWATYIIILCNILIFYIINIIFPSLKAEIFNIFKFLPTIIDLKSWGLTPITSMFLHANQSHLWWNMIYLWIFGIVVEKRIGWKRFVLLYFITGILGKFLSLVIFSVFLKIPYHEVGASGAIFGIMGVYIVRLYFKKMVFPVPILGFISLIFPIGLRIRMNSLIVMGLFLLSSLDAGILIVQGTETNIAHWTHLGGMIAGIVLSFRLKLQNDAVRERELNKCLQMCEKGEASKKAESYLISELDMDPNNETILLCLARTKSIKKPTRSGKKYYNWLLENLIETDKNQAVEIFTEYLKKYKSSLEPNLQYRLAGLLHKRKMTHEAMESLAAILKTDSLSKSMNEKITMQLKKMEMESGTHYKNKFEYFKIRK